MPDVSRDLQACVDALANLNKSVLDAASLIATCAKQHDGFLRKLCDAVPGVSMQFLRRLQRVGDGELDVRIALGIEHGLFLERLSLADQRKLIDVGVQVACGPRGEDVMHLKIEQMDRNMAVRVLHGGVIATLAQQRSSIIEAEDAARRTATAMAKDHLSDERKKKRALSKLPVVFDKKRGTATVMKETCLTVPMLYLMLRELE